MNVPFKPVIFRDGTSLTMGVNLQLQIVNHHNYDLARGTEDFIVALKGTALGNQIKSAITEGMIELNSSVHKTHDALLADLREIRTVITNRAKLQNVGIAGGGSHPFHQWHEQTIYPTERFKFISELYAYLAKRFTVFGQHIQIGCANGDEAVFLMHMMSRYIPHFIALSASSPFYLGHDTAFDSSRLNAVNAFPLSGKMPLVHSWEAVNGYFAKMHGFGIIKSMKDFYWDIRPKPEDGTIEIRVCDTPLTVEKAAMLAAYAQALARYHLVERPLLVNDDVYMLYNYNRFQACRFGLHGIIVDAITEKHLRLQDDVLTTISRVMPHAKVLGSEHPLQLLWKSAATLDNDTLWLRKTQQHVKSLHEVVRLQCDRWGGLDEP